MKEMKKHFRQSTAGAAAGIGFIAAIAVNHSPVKKTTWFHGGGGPAVTMVVNAPKVSAAY